MVNANQKLHVVLICNTDGALAVFRRPLIEHFISLGWRVSTISGGEKYLEDIRGLGAEPHVISFDRQGLSVSSNLRLLLDIWRLLRMLKPDVVHCFTHKANLFGVMAAVVCGIRGRFMTITGLGTAFVESGLKYCLVRYLLLIGYQLLGRHCGAVFFQNKDDLSLFTSARALKGIHHIVTGGSGVDLSRMPIPSGTAVATARSMLLKRLDRVGHAGPLVLLVARTVINKGINEYYAAARIVHKDRPDVLFIHLGTMDHGFDAVPVQRLAQDGHVHFLGFDPDPGPYMIAADLVVLASYREGMPRSLLEALAFDKPLVATDVPGCRETVIPGVNGLLCKVRDAKSLADAIQEVLKWPTSYYRGQSRKLCELRFDSRQLVEQTTKEYLLALRN